MNLVMDTTPNSGASDRTAPSAGVPGSVRAANLAARYRRLIDNQLAGPFAYAP